LQHVYSEYSRSGSDTTDRLVSVAFEGFSGTDGHICSYVYIKHINTGKSSPNKSIIPYRGQNLGFSPWASLLGILSLDFSPWASLLGLLSLSQGGVGWVSTVFPFGPFGNAARAKIHLQINSL
jgi:hypothetical protein